MYVSLNCLNNKVSAPQRQSGAVLIMALLIVAIVTGLSIKFASDYQLGFSRAESRWYGAQARAYFLSAENMAIKMLANDKPEVDDNLELWASLPNYPLPVPGGEVVGRLEDANSQFNINNLLRNKLDPAKVPLDTNRYDGDQRMFLRLLQEFPEIVHSPDEAVAILESIIYWADNSAPPGNMNADDQYYLNQPDPYRAPKSGTFRSVDELRLVHGVTPELMKPLRKFVTVNEMGQKLNVNTMPMELLRCLNLKADLGPLDPASAASLAGFIQDKPIEQMGDLEILIKRVGNPAEIDHDLEIKTKYFWLTISAHLGDHFQVQRSLLQRGDNNAPFAVVRREDVYAAF